MSYIVTKRVYKTADGRLTDESDPEAAFLAYPVGTELPDMEADRSGVRVYCDAPVTVADVSNDGFTATVPEKMAEPAANKMRKTAVANKTPGGPVATISTVKE